MGEVSQQAGEDKSTEVTGNPKTPQHQSGEVANHFQK
jgi:hypothetical protein